MFTQTLANANAEFQAAEKVLLDLDSPLSLQEQKLRQLPDIAAMQVPVLDFRSSLDGKGSQFGPSVTMPNAPRVRSLLLTYMRMDRAGALRGRNLPQTKQKSQWYSPAMTDFPPFYGFDVSYSWLFSSRSFQPVEDLAPLKAISNSLIQTLHRLGPSEELYRLADDAFVAKTRSLWSLGARFETVLVISLDEVHSYQPRSLSGPDGDEMRYDLRHLGPNDFVSLQASFLNADCTIFPVGANFANAHLEMSTFVRAVMTKANLDDAIVSGSNFMNAKLSGSSFFRTQLQRASFNEADLGFTNFYRSELQNTEFEACSLQWGSFEDAHLQQAEFFNCQMEGSNFESAHLQGASFRSCQCQGSTFENAEMQGANFQISDFTGSSFEDAYVSGCVFSDLQLLGANFSGVVLSPGIVTVNLFDLLPHEVAKKVPEQKLVVPGAVFRQCQFGSSRMWYPSHPDRALKELESGLAELNGDDVGFTLNDVVKALTGRSQKNFRLTDGAASKFELILGDAFTKKWTCKSDDLQLDTGLSSYILSFIASDDTRIQQATNLVLDPQCRADWLAALARARQNKAWEGREAQKDWERYSASIEWMTSEVESAEVRPEAMAERIKWSWRDQIARLCEGDGPTQRIENQVEQGVFTPSPPPPFLRQINNGNAGTNSDRNSKLEP